MVHADNTDEAIEAVDFGATDGAVPSSFPDDPTTMQARLQDAIAEFFANMRAGGPMDPSTELLRLLREAPAVIGREDRRRRAQLWLLTGLVHEFGRDVDGADRCYAEAGAARPNILKHGVLADLCAMAIRQRGRSGLRGTSGTERNSTGSMVLVGRTGGRRSTKPAVARS